VAVESPPAQVPADLLPRYLTRTVGGDAAVQAVAAALRQTRLLVLRGPGGLGKTRLAVTAARRLLEAGEVDTARFVSWVGCAALEPAAERLAQALGLAARPAGRGGVEAVLDGALVALAGRRALLVLDNAETLPEAALALAPGLLERLPGLRLLVTSRRALGWPGAQDHPVTPLALQAPPGVDGSAALSPAAQLFVERARDVRPDFQAPTAQRAAIEALVQRLGGLPLAIELAAARVRTLPPARLLALLAEGGAERWRALGRRGAAALADPRHASIEAVLEASLALLSPAARTLVHLAAAVGAPFSGALAEHAGVARGLPRDAALAAMDELAADSLIVAAAGIDTDVDDPWWTLPEPVRDLVAETLPPPLAAEARAAWRAALRKWSAALAPAWPLAEVERSMPMLQAVLGQGATAAETRSLLLALAPVWQEQTPPASLRARLDAALDGDAGPPSEALRARALAADLAFAGGDRESARRHAAGLEAVLHAPATAVDAHARAEAHLSLARAAWRGDGDAGRARQHLRQAERLQGDAADGGQMAEAHAQRLRFEAALAYEAGRDTEACDALLHQALRVLAGSPAAAGHLPRALHYNLAISAIHAGRPEAALPLLQALAVDAAAVGNRRLLADVLNATGSAFDALGRLAEAETATRAGLAEAWQRLETENALYGLWNLGLLALAQGRPERAARLLGFADRFWRRHFGELNREDRGDVLRGRRRCRRELGRAAGQRAWNEGAALPLAAAVALALG
jgi:predicted ATPase